jgi:hypothetical protein
MKKVVFNQGAYHTFDGLDLERSALGAPYAGLQNLQGVLTVSEDSRSLLHSAFPDLRIELVRNVVDPAIFSPGQRSRRKAIAYVPTRRELELRQLLHTLRARGVDWELVPIRGMSEHEVARTLQSASVFLSLSELDGFGLPAAEAMACGCFVVGYHGGGGREFFDRSYCCPVVDLAELITAVDDATRMPDAKRTELGLMASAAVLRRYSEQGLREDLETFYGSIL